MIDIDSLNEQNHKIADLAKVLATVINKRELCDTSVANDLFFNYISSVEAHLKVEEQDLYRLLLVHNDKNIQNTAKRFLSGSGEIKRVFKQYQKRWCRYNKLYINDHYAFIKDSGDMFEMVFKRVVDETENLYPAVRMVMQEKVAA